MNLRGIKTRSPIALDIGSRTVKAVQLTARSGNWSISAATSFPRALLGAAITPSEVRRMVDVLYRHNFHGRDVVLCAPPLRLLDGALELPKAEASLDQVARLEFARLQKCEPSAMEMGYWPLPAGPRSHQANRVMAVGCLHRDVEPLIATVESEGLRVVGMDAEACALARACEPRLAEQVGLTGLLDFGWNCCRLAVLYQGAIVYSRVLNDSGIASLFKSLEKHLEIDAQMAEHVLQELGLTPAHTADEDPIADARDAITAHFDAMLQELNISFSYATQQYPEVSLQRLLVCGGGARITGVIEHLSALLGVEGMTIAPKDVVTCPAGLQCADSPALTLAVGLAQFRDE
jgi:type IV pilus assembly protein PilM